MQDYDLHYSTAQALEDLEMQLMGLGSVNAELVDKDYFKKYHEEEDDE